MIGGGRVGAQEDISDEVGLDLCLTLVRRVDLTPIGAFCISQRSMADRALDQYKPRNERNLGDLALIHEERGVVGSLMERREWAGVDEYIYGLRWVTEPGSLRLRFERPALCIVSSEVGGRSELRRDSEEPVAGEYYGAGALAFIAAGDPLVVHAAEMREARLSCFLFDAAGAGYVTSEDAGRMAAAGTRYMFRDERLRTCASVLDDEEIEAGSGRFAASLSRALFASVLEFVRLERRASGCELSGAAFERVASYIRDHLDRTIRGEDLARVAAIEPDRFGQAFREATGLSPRRWQMVARVRTAQRLMVDDPNANLAEIATLSGFADQSHFSRAFLEVVGVTPTAWLHRRQ